MVFLSPSSHIFPFFIHNDSTLYICALVKQSLNKPRNEQTNKQTNSSCYPAIISWFLTPSCILGIEHGTLINVFLALTFNDYEGHL
jgi:hypothetical protein